MIGISLLQALLADAILYLAGVSGAGLIAFGVLILCIIQIGPASILLPVLIWRSHATSFALALTDGLFEDLEDALRAFEDEHPGGSR